MFILYFTNLTLQYVQRNRYYGGFSFLSVDKNWGGFEECFCLVPGKEIVFWRARYCAQRANSCRVRGIYYVAKTRRPTVFLFFFNSSRHNHHHAMRACVRNVRIKIILYVPRSLLQCTLYTLYCAVRIRSPSRVNNRSIKLHENTK